MGFDSDSQNQSGRAATREPIPRAAPDEHGACPACHADLNGGLIWDTFRGRGNTEAEADRIAAMYGATRTSGQWGRAIAIYSIERDCTVAYRCPDCEHEWQRGSSAQPRTSAGYGLPHPRTDGSDASGMNPSNSKGQQ